jgi:hypothetical protein
MYKSQSVRDYGVIGNLFKFRAKETKKIEQTSTKTNIVKDIYSAIFLNKPECPSIDVNYMEPIVERATNISKNVNELYQAVNSDFSYNLYSSDGTAYSLIIYNEFKKKIYCNVPIQINQYYTFVLNGNKYLFILRDNIEYSFYKYSGEYT